MFSGEHSDDALHADAADNILIAWPPIIEFVARRVCPPAALLDFGCGGGRLVKEMTERGYKASGLDPSQKMIDSARSAFPAMDFHVGEADHVTSLGGFDVITYVMALQFVADIDHTLAELIRSLTDHGILVFAVHNPDFVQDGLERGLYPKLHETSSGLQTALTFRSAVTIPLFVRTAQDYDRIVTAHGLRRRLHCEPPFTDEFIARYGGRANRYSEYLILGYDKR